MFVLVVKVEADVATITVKKKKKIEMQLQYYITFCYHRIHYTSQWRRIAYKNILCHVSPNSIASINDNVVTPKNNEVNNKSILHHFSKLISASASRFNGLDQFHYRNGFLSIYFLPGFAYLWSRKEYLPSGLDVCHYAGNSRVALVRFCSCSFYLAKLFLVAGNMGFEVALVGLRPVKRGQSCVVSQPQTVATFVDMQRDATVHRMPVMMIVHEMRECAFFLITVHCKNELV